MGAKTEGIEEIKLSTRAKFRMDNRAEERKYQEITIQVEDEVEDQGHPTKTEVQDIMSFPSTIILFYTHTI